MRLRDVVASLFIHLDGAQRNCAQFCKLCLGVSSLLVQTLQIDGAFLIRFSMVFTTCRISISW